MNVIFTFVPLGMVSSMHEQIKWCVISNESNLVVDVPLFYFDFLCREH